VATQDPDLVRGLDVAGKKYRVFNYHKNTVNSFLEILGAAGLSHPDELRPRHIQRRVSLTEVQDYGRIYEYLEPGALLSSPPSATSPTWGNFIRGLGSRQRGAFLTGTYRQRSGDV